MYIFHWFPAGVFYLLFSTGCLFSYRCSNARISVTIILSVICVSFLIFPSRSQLWTFSMDIRWLYDTKGLCRLFSFMSLLNPLIRECVTCRILKQVGPVKTLKEKLRIRITLRPCPNYRLAPAGLPLPFLYPSFFVMWPQIAGQHLTMS
jgi:hypothetical protein